MLELLGVAFLLIAVGAGGYMAKQRKRVEPSPRRKPAHHYRAVAVRHSLLSCQAVNRLDGKRFLATEAPSLPVKGCDVWPCRCRYEYLADRRQEERRSLYGIQRNLAPHAAPQDRRQLDRRRSAGSYA
jgi:hypothetical protein